MSNCLPRITWLALGIGLAVSSPATGSPYQQGDKIFDVQLFRPGAAPGDFLNVKGTATLGHGDLFMSAYLIYMRNPLRTPLVPAAGGGDIVVTQDQLGLDLAAALGLWHRFNVGVALPVSVRQTCVASGGGAGGNLCQAVGSVGLSDQNYDGGGIGDLRLDLRGTIVRPRATGFGLAAGATVSFPTAGATAFVGETNLKNLEDPSAGHTFSPTGTFYLALDDHIGRFGIGLNLGYLVRRHGDFRLLRLRDQLVYGLAGEIRIVKGLAALAELDGSLSVQDTSRRNSPHNVLVGARYRLGWWRFDLGGGTGIMGDYGAPDARVFLGVAYTGPVLGVDSDGDKIPDDRDRCPDEPEDKDGFEDSDGCPDYDNDQDGIVDALDKCPNIAAVTADGCPANDSDGDRIPDDRDHCPNEPEDKDGFEDNDGCPDPDNDGDGICDPWVEAKGQSDKYAKVCHGADKCPGQPETYNGYKDDDGCPDEAPAIKPAQPPTVTPTRITIAEKIGFAEGTADLTDASKQALDRVAHLLHEHPEVKLIRIQGHTDGGERGRRLQLRLSSDRARAVMNYLVSKSVSRKRLQAAGYGSTRPIASSDTKEGRARNRRVEFIIVERSPQ